MILERSEAARRGRGPKRSGTIPSLLDESVHDSTLPSLRHPRMVRGSPR